jgi:hypothetical protein
MIAYRQLVAGACVVLAGAVTVVGSYAQAAEPSEGANIDGRTVYLQPNARLRYGEGLLSRIYARTNATMELKGRGSCSKVACPVVHNNVNVFARRAVLDLERPSGPIVTERTLRRGDEGDDVKAMQEALNKKGRIQVKVDGSFGPDMEEAVREFQSKAGLGVDGEIGAQTREKLRV